MSAYVWINEVLSWLYIVTSYSYTSAGFKMAPFKRKRLAMASILLLLKSKHENNVRKYRSVFWIFVNKLMHQWNIVCDILKEYD